MGYGPRWFTHPQLQEPDLRELQRPFGHRFIQTDPGVLVSPTAYLANAATSGHTARFVSYNWWFSHRSATLREIPPPTFVSIECSEAISDGETDVAVEGGRFRGHL